MPRMISLMEFQTNARGTSPLIKGRGALPPVTAKIAEGLKAHNLPHDAALALGKEIADEGAPIVEKEIAAPLAALLSG